VRWRHPQRGLISPDQFIPVAESSGLIVPLGDWILQQACNDAASWPAPLRLAVNLSAVQFNKGNLFDVVLCALDRVRPEPGPPGTRDYRIRAA
jgi:EAL domain-containing protein (putative c-di-GMP-specific phosphodiesterase class I)